LTPEETNRLEAFLKPSHIVVVATIGRSGMPHLTPNWYVYRDGKLMISTTKERVKYKNASRDKRMSVCVYSDLKATSYATITGPVVIRDDDSIWPDTQAIVERYVPPEGVENRMSQLHSQNRVILDLIPDKVSVRNIF
jgi:PPOX class probable F420-dependent enzyme